MIGAEYASIQAILYGPYLLAALSDGDWDINAKLSYWITPVPSEYNSRLVSLSQQSGDSTYVIITNTNTSLSMQSLPKPGTNSAASSSFRLVLKDTGNFSKPEDAIGKLVMLEPFHLPGMAIAEYGEGKDLGVKECSSDGSGVFFRMVAGLDGEGKSVSLESGDKKGCFVCSDSGTLRLCCSTSKSWGEDFKRGTSFTMHKGLAEYHPISFVAKGMHKNFLLSPLLALRDESYTIYFDFHS